MEELSDKSQVKLDLNENTVATLKDIRNAVRKNPT